MTPQKVLEVLNLYIGVLETSCAKPNRADLAQQVDIHTLEGRARLRGHLLWMCQEAKRSLTESMEQYPGGTQSKIEKAMRWLGYIQGCLACLGICTVEELRRHNMPEGEEYRP